jgi:hypothetical protein
MHVDLLAPPVQYYNNHDKENVHTLVDLNLQGTFKDVVDINCFSYYL